MELPILQRILGELQMGSGFLQGGKHDWIEEQPDLPGQEKRNPGRERSGRGRLGGVVMTNTDQSSDIDGDDEIKSWAFVKPRVEAGDEFSTSMHSR